MITTYVYFDFETKSEWIDFANKLSCKNEFTKYLSTERRFNKQNLSFADLVEYYSDDLCLVSICFCITTRSEKTLRKLNDWIKDNHYESNYELRDLWGNRMKMNLEKLFEYCRNRANKCIN